LTLNWDFIFFSAIHLNPHYEQGISEKTVNQFQTYIKTKTLRIIGGDVNTVNISDWVKSVSSGRNASPYLTRLSFIGDLFPEEKREIARLAFQKMLEVCPADSNSVSCGGRGICDVDSGKCKCQKGIAGPACDQYDCSLVTCLNQGKCNPKTGLCECPLFKNGFSGCSCSKACGVFEFFGPLPFYDYCDENGDNCGRPSAQCACSHLFPGSSVVQWVVASDKSMYTYVPCSPYSPCYHNHVGCQYFEHLTCSIPCDPTHCYPPTGSSN